jgi:hypothetical protein
MSIKSKVLAAAATLALVGGVGTAGALSAGTASVATPSCGGSCINLFSHQFGSFASPNYTVDVLRQDEKTGQPIILFRQANYDPALDWTVAYQDNVSDFYEADLVGAEDAVHYGCVPPVNFPDCYGQISVPGVAATAFSGEGVTLPPGGVPAKTLGIADIDNPATLLTGSVPLINGSNTNFSQPFVLTYPVGSYRTGMPRPQLQADSVTGRQAVQPGGTA